MRRAVLYTRVSTFDQNPETQALDLRRLAEQSGFEIVHEYTDRISGAILLAPVGRPSPPAKPGLRDSPENSFEFHQNSLGCRGAARSETPAL